jgi:sulfoxide reductase heme-binding subunit YedZ
MVAVVLLRWGAGEDGLRAGIRATAGSSFALLMVVFVASPLNALFTSSATKWLLANRRYLGVSFAVSQLAHAILIGALASTHPSSFWRRLAMTTLVGGGLGYVLTALMTVTSFDRPAAWLGRRRWRLLHTAGVYYLWAIFFFSYVGRAASPRYAALVVVLAASLALRVAAAVRRRARAVARSR